MISEPTDDPEVDRVAALAEITLGPFLGLAYSTIQFLKGFGRCRCELEPRKEIEFLAQVNMGRSDLKDGC